MKPHKVIRKIAKMSDHRVFHHGVIAMRGGSVVSVGTNIGWVHAEVAALRRIWPDQRKGLKIISIRIARSGRLANGKPCLECQKHLKENGIKTIWYSNSKSEMEMMRI